MKGSKKTLLLALFAGVAACHGQPNGANAAAASSQSNLAAQAADAEPVSAMLKGGRPEACAHPAVKQRIMSDVDDGLANATPESLNVAYTGATQEDVDQALKDVPEPMLKDTQAVSTDTSVGSIDCAVHLQFPEYQTTVQYTLKPSLDDPSDFLMGYVGSGAHGARRDGVVSKAMALGVKRVAARNAANPPQAVVVGNAM